MQKCFNGLYAVHLELTSRCNKNSCWMCGRRKLERDLPELVNWGDMNFDLVKSIAEQLPPGIVVQFHNNGEPLLYPRFGEAVKLFYNHIKCMDTNGKLLLEKADEIIDNLDTLTISVIENDPEGNEQYEIVKKFLEIKKNKKPIMIYRLLGNVALTPHTMLKASVINKKNKERWYKLPGIVATRILHNPMGSYDYIIQPTIPEVGFCTEIINHIAIDRFGNVYPCVRFDPNKYNLLGNLNKNLLISIWNGKKRKYLIKEHVSGNRKCSDLCSTCEYYGIPRGK